MADTCQYIGCDKPADPGHQIRVKHPNGDIVLLICLEHLVFIEGAQIRGIKFAVVQDSSIQFLDRPGAFEVKHRWALKQL